MKTAISLPDPLFAEADDLARRLGKSRSQLYAEAVAEYVARHDSDEITRRMNETLEAVGATEGPALEDRAVLRSHSRILKRVEW